MPLNTEKIVNAKLAEGLRGKYPGWRIGAEQTQVFVERAKQPDIVVSHASTLTVIVESEFAPASRVEADARSRLGSTIKGRGEEIEQSVAIKLPASPSKCRPKGSGRCRAGGTVFLCHLYHGRRRAV